MQSIMNVASRYSNYVILLVFNKYHSCISMYNGGMPQVTLATRTNVDEMHELRASKIPLLLKLHRIT